MISMSYIFYPEVKQRKNQKIERDKEKGEEKRREDKENSRNKT